MAIVKREWKTYDTLHAIDSFRSYWRVNEGLISQDADRLEEINAPKWTPHTEEEHGEFYSEKQMARYFHDNQMLPTFRYSCVVMLYVIIERELLRLVKNLEKENGPQELKHSDIGGHLIKQVETYTEVFFGLRLSQCPHYQSLHDLRKIRNCIVHCHGELALIRNKTDARYLIRLSKSRRGFYAGSTISIYDRSCLEQFTKEIRELFEGVFHQFNWAIDDCWEKEGKA
jgi:hypothetical protein